MSILIKRANIITQNRKRDQFIGDIFLEDDIISEMSNKSISCEADFKIDGIA